MLKMALKHQLLSSTLRAGRDGFAKDSPEQQVGDDYRAAMNTTRLNQLGLEPIKADLAQAATASTPMELARFSVNQFRKSGSSPVLMAWPTRDLKDNTRMVLVLLPGGPQLEQNQYTDSAAQRIRDLLHELRHPPVAPDW